MLKTFFAEGSGANNGIMYQGGNGAMHMNDPQMMYQMAPQMATGQGEPTTAAQQMQMMYQGNMWAQALGMAEMQAQQIVAEGGTVTDMALHTMAQGWMQASMQVNAQEWQAQQAQHIQQQISK